MGQHLSLSNYFTNVLVDSDQDLSAVVFSTSAATRRVTMALRHRRCCTSNAQHTLLWGVLAMTTTVFAKIDSVSDISHAIILFIFFSDKCMTTYALSLSLCIFYFDFSFGTPPDCLACMPSCQHHARLTTLTQAIIFTSYTRTCNNRHRRCGPWQGERWSEQDS